jgi:deazaflavin-dependent oxidoreductase (nitroreductase family)
MPLPRWLARFNRRVFNPRQVQREKWPIMTHVGRTTGQMRKTPLDAFPFDGGFVFLVNYDSKKADWVLNIMQAGRSSLLFHGETSELTNPRIVSKAEAADLAGDGFKPPPNWMNVEFMAMDASPVGDSGASA